MKQALTMRRKDSTPRTKRRPRLGGLVPLASLVMCLSMVVEGGPGSASATAPSASSTTVPLSKSQKASSEVVTFGTQTATPTGVDNRGFYNYGIGAGGRLTDHIAVINDSLQTVTLLIRPVDAVNTPQGGIAAEPIYERPTEVGSWMMLSPGDDTVTLEPRSRVILTFSVTVPTNTAPGDYLGAITATLQSTVASKSGQRAHLDQTTGTRVFIRVAGPLYPKLQVEDLEVHYMGTLTPVGKGKAKVTYVVKNVGNIALGADQSVYVSGLFGAKAAATRLPIVPLLLPGYSVREAVLVQGIFPEIRETAHVRVSLLYLPGSVQPQSGPFSAGLGFWAIPWTLIAVVGVVLIALGLRLRRWRKGRRGVGTVPKEIGGVGGSVLEVPDEVEVSVAATDRIEESFS